jgi:predicted phosphate transport protein (TIGR00153 family)
MSIAAIGRLFGRSPFAPLQAHMEKVAHCVQKLTEIFEAFEGSDHTKVQSLAKEISKLEHGADLTKNDIRNHLPKSLFMPIARESLLEILAIQDSIADQAEDIAVLLTLRNLTMIDSLREPFHTFLNKNLEAFEAAHQVLQELHDLLESSFGGSEAEKVKKMIHEVAKKEHQVDLLQRDLLKIIFSMDDLPAPVLHLWLLILEAVADLSNLSEKLANRIHMTLETKS